MTVPGTGLVRWKVWYTEGRTFEGSSGEEFAALPDDGFIGMTICYPDGTRRVASGDDYYWTAPGDAGPIYAHGTNNLSPEIIAKRYPGASIKLGRWTDEQTIREVTAALMTFAPYSTERDL